MPEFHAVMVGESLLSTPSGQPMQVPTPALASLVSEEWPDTQASLRNRGPLTRLADAAIEAMPSARSFWLGEAKRYAETDLLCFLAPSPAGLVERQKQIWGPIRDWAATHKGIELKSVFGIMAGSQPPASLEALAEYVQALDDFRLAGLARTMALTGSVLLALALAHRHLSADQTLQAARLDEDWQAERWGQDPEAQIQAKALRQELETLERWFAALGE